MLSVDPVPRKNQKQYMYFLWVSSPTFKPTSSIPGLYIIDPQSACHLTALVVLDSSDDQPLGPVLNNLWAMQTQAECTHAVGVF